jgi:Flp pilus assembly protein CpaB
VNGWSRLRRHAVEPGRSPDGNGSVALRLRERPGAPSAVAPWRSRWWRQPLPLVGVGLVVVALVGSLALVNSATHRDGVVVATRDLAPGTVVRSGDVRVAKLATDRATLAGLVPADGLSELVGRTVRTGVAAGTPIATAAVGRSVSEPDAFTLVVPVAHALGGGLRAGDHVTVLATYQTADGQAIARPVARNLVVVSVGQPPSGIGTETASVSVTVLLPIASLASALALANSDGKIDLLREGSRDRTAPIPAASEGTGR